MMPEEAKVLSYLRQHSHASVRDVAAVCGQARVARIVADLDWQGYVTVFYEPGGEPSALQITERGRRQA